VPVAEIVPHAEGRSPWRPAAELRRIVAETPADAALMEDLALVRERVVDEP
jgi:antitoxin (DNA-binding transcriptional repressor) of toxin-antitoxin stability system